MVAGQILGISADNTIAVEPRPLQNLVRGPVEVKPIDVGGFDDVSVWQAWRRYGGRFRASVL